MAENAIFTNFLMKSGLVKLFSATHISDYKPFNILCLGSEILACTKIMVKKYLMTRGAKICSFGKFH